MDLAPCGEETDVHIKRLSESVLQPKSGEKKEPTNVDTFVIPLRNFWDIIWKSNPLEFCNSDERDDVDVMSGGTCSKISDTSNSRHRRSRNIIYDSIPSSIKADINTEEEITSPLSSPTTSFTTPRGNFQSFTTPDKPNKSSLILPKVGRDPSQFHLPTGFRVDRNIVRVLFGGETGILTTVKKFKASNEPLFQGYCFVSARDLSTLAPRLTAEDVHFVAVSENENDIRFSQNEVSEPFRLIKVDNSLNIRSIKLSQRIGYGVKLEKFQMDRDPEVLSIFPIDSRFVDEFKTHNHSLIDNFQQAPSSLEGEWGTLKFLEENFASWEQHDKFINLMFVLDMLRFKHSPYYDCQF